MELRHLAYLLAVVEEGSFTRAAVRLRIAQPGVSATVRQLEREVGQELLDRTGRSVTLTAAGEVFVPHARAALAAAETARRAVEELAGLVSGRVSVGMITASSPLRLAEVLAGFHRSHPGVTITLRESDTTDLLDGVRVGRLDFAWVALAGSVPEGVETQIIWDEELVAAVAPDDPLAKRRTVRIADLRGRPMVSLPVGTATRQRLEDVCAAEGFAPQVACEASALPVLASLAAGGLGLAVLPLGVAQSRSYPLHVLRFRGVRMRGQLAIAWRVGGPTNPAGRVLLHHVRSIQDQS